MRDLGKKTVAGAAWMVGMRLAENLLGLASTVILVRLLTPADFGVVALAGSAYAFFRVLGQFGFDTALIQARMPERAHYDTAWTANILVGLGTGIATAASAKPAAAFFDDPRIENVVYCFAVLSLAKGFENIGVVNFRKSLQFRGDFFYFVLPKITSLIIGVGAAFVLRNYWALVVGMAASQLAGLLYSHFSQPYRPRFSLAKFKELLHYTRWVLGNNLLQYLAKNVLEVILGRLRDTGSVGIFVIARQIAFLPSTEILAPINRALFPSFSTISDDRGLLRRAFYKVFSVTTTLSFPAAFGVWVLSEAIVHVVFGDRWADVAPVLSVLGFIGALDALRSLTSPILLACGVPKALTQTLVVYVALLLPSAAIAAYTGGPVGLSIAMLACSSTTLPMMFWAVRREIQIELRGIVRHSWRPLLAAVLMAVVVSEVENALVGAAGATVAELIALVTVGAVSYGAFDIALWALVGKPAETAESVLLGMVLNRMSAAAAR